MKKSFYLCLAVILLFSLPACQSAGALNETEAVTESNTSGIIEQRSEYKHLSDTHKEESYEEDNTGLDAAFTQSVDSDLPPFEFHILGERYDYIDSINISNADGEIIQKIDGLCAWASDNPEYEHYGIEFSDYNSDGCMDMSMRRVADYMYTNFYWLWDKEKQQFVYDWKLSEAVTESNLIDFYTEQSLHDGAEPLTFRLLGRWVDLFSSDGIGETDPNIQIIQVMDKSGEIIQEFGRLDALPPSYEPDFGLHFADYNFDGYLDMALYISRGGSMRNEPHLYWLWNEVTGQFEENEELSEISDYSSISINPEYRSLSSYTRDGVAAGITRSFEYEDGKYILSGYVAWDYKEIPGRDGEYGRYVINMDVSGDELIITEEYYDDEETVVFRKTYKEPKPAGSAINGFMR